jgi:hypothetical protein
MPPDSKGVGAPAGKDPDLTRSRPLADLLPIGVDLEWGLAAERAEQRQFAEE